MPPYSPPYGRGPTPTPTPTFWARAEADMASPTAIDRARGETDNRGARGMTHPSVGGGRAGWRRTSPGGSLTAIPAASGELAKEVAKGEPHNRYNPPCPSGGQ